MMTSDQNINLLQVLSTVLLGTTLFLSCTSSKEERNPDSTPTTSNEAAAKNRGVFSGEYLIGDGGTFVVPVGEAYEMRNEKGEKSDVLYLQGVENDTLSIYSNSDKSIIFKMNPDHKSGMYYESDEQWPVSLISLVTPNPVKETETEETDRIMKQRHDEDSVLYSQLGIYDGKYQIETESDGVNATLELKYNGDQTFNYEWSFEVANDEIHCDGHQKGILAMDRTQHGIDVNNGCIVHFNFNGYYASGYVVEINFDDQSKCTYLKGECTFSGTYLKN